LALTFSGAALVAVALPIEWLVAVRFEALVVVWVVSVTVVLTAGADCAGALACFFEPPPPQPARAPSSTMVAIVAVRLTPRLNTYTGAE
jgi:hypothetical protein